MQKQTLFKVHFILKNFLLPDEWSKVRTSTLRKQLISIPGRLVNHSGKMIMRLIEGFPYLQLLGAAIVHPDFKEVVPLCPEMIIKQDGETKNDCERNAAKRFFEQLRKDHPHLPLIINEDALSPNAPHITDMKKYNLHYILGVKPGDVKRKLFLLFWLKNWNHHLGI